MFHGIFAVQKICMLFSVVIQFVRASDVIVQTQYGKIRGIQTSKTKSFFGIPYAKPPIGDLRWENAEDARPWSPDIYNATTEKPGCPQKDCEHTLPPNVCPTAVSEDCLYLNIWTPLKANSTTSFPVFVFIHGGDFVGMSASSLLFDAENITYKGDVIAVTMDYRLGALGFLVTSDTPKQKGLTGNFGILDQRLAIKWIHENIHAFGGDPNQVTVGGQSAGAQSTVVHLMTKDTSQYFQKAIIQSAPFSIPFRSRDEALFLGDRLAAELGCNNGDLECLREKTADEISTAQKVLRNQPTSLRLLEFFQPWGPYVDGNIVPFEPLVAIKNGNFFDKPVVIGTVTEETRIYIYTAWGKPVSTREYAEVLLATFPKNFFKVFSQYPTSSSTDQRDTLVQMGTDFLFTCSTRNYTRTMLQKGSSKVYHYIYNHAFSFPGWGNFTCCTGHVCHGSELPFIFQSRGNFTVTADEEALSDSLLYYWTNFIKTGNPNEGHQVSLAWPNYSPELDWQYILFQTPASNISSHFQSNRCSFWDQIGYKA